MKHKKGLQKNPSQTVSFLHDEIDLNYEPHFEGHIWTPSSGYFCFHVSLAGEQLHHMPSHLRRRFHPFFAAEPNLGAMESWEVSPQVLTWTVLGLDIFGDSVSHVCLKLSVFGTYKHIVVVE